jgi:hypothetical protein
LTIEKEVLSMNKVLGFLIFVLLVGALGASAPSGGYKIPDFKCGYDGQMVSGFQDGKPVCSTPAGFIMPNLKCPDIQSWNPQVLVGIKDGQPVCKGIYVDWSQDVLTNVYSTSEQIHISIRLQQPLQPR